MLSQRLFQRTSFGVFLLAGLASASAQAGSDDFEGIVRDPEFGELSARWASAVEELRVPGMAVVVLEGDEILHLETFGLRDVVNGKPVTPDTIFYIASATKPFVAFAAKQLEEQGKLDLDAPVKRYLPRLELADAEVARSMTVRDLLCHRPGLSNFPVVFLDAYTGQITEDRYYHFLAGTEPTGIVTYSNVHFTLAGRVVEAVGGAHWKDVLASSIFEPAGMSRTTGYADTMYADADVAYPSSWVEGGFEYASVRKTDATMHAAGGLGTTIKNAANWIRLHLGEGMLGDTRLMSREGMAEMLSNQSESAEMQSRGIDGFGLGWMRGQRYGHTRYQHGGGYVGTAAMISFVPDIGLGVAVLANAGGIGSSLCDLVTADVYAFLMAENEYDPLPGLIERRRRSLTNDAGSAEGENPAAAAGALSAPVDAYVGDYTNEHWGTLRVERDGDLLVGRLGNIRLSLHARGQDRFFAFNANSFEGDGSFEVNAGEVSGIRVDIAGNEVRFER